MRPNGASVLLKRDKRDMPTRREDTSPLRSASSSVLLDGKNIKLKVDGPRKLMHRFLGPFEVFKKVER